MVNAALTDEPFAKVIVNGKVVEVLTPCGMLDRAVREEECADRGEGMIAELAGADAAETRAALARGNFASLVKRERRREFDPRGVDVVRVIPVGRGRLRSMSTVTRPMRLVSRRSRPRTRRTRTARRARSPGRRQPSDPDLARPAVAGAAP